MGGSRKVHLLETEPLEGALFVERPNRFTVRFRRGRREGVSFMANPGRLGEILLPGMELLIAPRPGTRTGWETVGATWSRRWKGDRPRTVFLNAARVNALGQRLIEEELIPELAGHRIVKREYGWAGAGGPSASSLGLNDLSKVACDLAPCIRPPGATNRLRRSVPDAAARISG